jgi:rhodanese-related sulfurtransferase
MTKAAILSVISVSLMTPSVAGTMDLPRLLDHCTANLDQFRSWTIQCSSSYQWHGDGRAGPNTVEEFDLRCDGAQMCHRRWLWPDVDKLDGKKLNRADAQYRRLMWDGQMYKKYLRGTSDGNGRLFLDDFSSFEPDIKEFEAQAIQARYEGNFATGYCFASFDRLDVMLREAQTAALRKDMEKVNGTPCYVVDATTKYGDLTVWIDPDHAYAIARYRIEANKAAGHLHCGRALISDHYIGMSETTRFECVEGIWIGCEATQRRQLTLESAQRTRQSRIDITEFVPNPHHEKLRSFEQDDVPNGTLVIIPPVTHIRYVWQDGELIKHIDEGVVAWIDATLATMIEPGEDSAAPIEIGMTERATAPIGADPNGASALVQKYYPWLRPRAHCGLYCMYGLLRLKGHELSFRDLVVPEYLGQGLGSSMAELNQAAHDYGLHAGVAARLSTRALRRSPYPAILHVKAEPYAKEYDHYTLYLGAEKGKARLFSPPEEPKLVDFAELAPLWDGYALFVSQRPFDIDTLFGPDRQRLYFCGMGAVVLILIAHVLRRLWLLVTPALSRRWTLGLTAGQAGTLALIALLAGGSYHFASDEGLLANPVGAAGVQKAHAGAFITKISAKKARQLLGEDVVVLDARMTRDYERGHLEGAISLPIDANDALWEATIPTIPRGRSIVAYCQSAGCKYAEQVSLKLMDQGFDDIVIFKGGWVEWEKKYGRPAAPEKEVKQDASDDPNV